MLIISGVQRVGLASAETMYIHQAYITEVDIKLKKESIERQLHQHPNQGVSHGHPSTSMSLSGHTQDTARHC